MKKVIILTMTAFICACSGNIEQKNISPMTEKKNIKLLSRQMTPEVLWTFGRIGHVEVSPNGKQVAYTVTWYDVKQNAGNSEIYIMDTDGGNKKQLTRSPERESAIKWRPDGAYLGFIRKGKVYEIRLDGTGEREIVIPVGEKSINEFNYSPDGKKLLLAIDTPVTKVLGKDIYDDLPKANAYIAEDLMYRHWDTWKDGTFTHLYIAKYDDGTVSEPEDVNKDEHWDTPSKPFDDISETSWSPDSRILAYSSKKLVGKEYAESTNSNIYLYNTESRQTEILTDGMSGYDKSPSFSPDGSKLLWLSMERAGYEADKARLLVYSFDDKTKTDYSKEFDSNPSGIVWSKDGKSLYFTACFEETFRIFRMTFSEDGASGIFQQISGDGFFDYQHIQETADGFVVNRSQLITPTEIYKFDAATSESAEISFVNKDILDQLDLPEMELHWITTTDNKDMPAWVILPPNADKSIKYPCILMATGGPQGEISQSYSYRWNYALMASQGYVVIYPARRGVSGYGQEWSDAVSRDHGGQPERDLLSAADYIASQPWIDENRIGAVGASYGGYSVFWLAGNHNKRFKAFIAHCGIFDMHAMYTTTEEMFFENWETGPFWDANNAKHYEQSPVNFIKNWDTPILIFHGEHDYRVPYTQGLAAFNSARMMNLPAKLVVFPEETHWILRPQNAILWQREFFTWMDKWVKGVKN